MPDLVVIVPTRSRPQAVHELTETFAATRTADTAVLFVVDDDDPADYGHLPVNRGDTRSMNEALNRCAAAVANDKEPPFAIGFMGDDHRPRTYGWDKAYVEALRDMGTGIVYGNDLLQGANLPTQVAMTSDIVRALGYFAPPKQKHLYLDNFWKDLGKAAGCLRYLPDVIVEHVHPIAGKAPWDEGYSRVNDQAMYQHDFLAYQEYRRTQFDADVAKVKAL